MVSLIDYVIMAAAAALISWLLTAIVRPLARRWQVLDRPDSQRKIHRQPVPLLGGWAIYLTLLLAGLALVWAGKLPDPKVSILLLVSFFVAGLMLMIGGWLDDKSHLPWWQSLFFPAAAALIMISGGLHLDFITNPFGGLIYVKDWAPLVADGFLFAWLLGMVYTTKLLDGLDGLAGSIGLVAAVAIFVVSLFWDEPQSITSYLAIALAGSLVGFLIWNWHPAKIFLGESGSTFIGFTLGVLAILTGAKIATALLVMGLPILDVAWVILRRLAGHKNVALADTGHLHFRLLRLGLRQPQVVLVMAGLAALFGSVSFFVSSLGKLIALVTVVLIMGIGAFLLMNWQKSHAK